MYADDRVHAGALVWQNMPCLALSLRDNTVTERAPTARETHDSPTGVAVARGFASAAPALPAVRLLLMRGALCVAGRVPALQRPS